MKTVLTGPILLCVIASAQVSSNPCDHKEAQTGEQLMRSWVEFWNTKDPDRLDVLYADDAVFEDVAEGATYRGLAAIKQCLSEDIAYAPDVIVEIVSVYSSENRGVLEWTWSGTQTGDIPGLMPATGRKFSVRGVSIFEFENNRIIRQSDYYDAAGFLHQLGVKFEFPAKL